MTRPDGVSMVLMHFLYTNGLPQSNALVLFRYDPNAAKICTKAVKLSLVLELSSTCFANRATSLGREDGSGLERMALLAALQNRVTTHADSSDMCLWGEFSDPYRKRVERDRARNLATRNRVHWTENQPSPMKSRQPKYSGSSHEPSR